jgi:hypothetical protein
MTLEGGIVTDGVYAFEKSPLASQPKDKSVEATPVAETNASNQGELDLDQAGAAETTEEVEETEETEEDVEDVDFEDEDEDEDSDV